MRLTARFAAPLLALVAFAVPATVPAAHAASIPAGSAVVVHQPSQTGGGFTADTIYLARLQPLTIVNASLAPQTYTVTPSAVWLTSSTVSSPGFAVVQFGSVTQPVLATTYVLRAANGSAVANVVVV